MNGLYRLINKCVHVVGTWRGAWPRDADILMEFSVFEKVLTAIASGNLQTPLEQRTFPMLRHQTCTNESSTYSPDNKICLPKLRPENLKKADR